MFWGSFILIERQKSLNLNDPILEFWGNFQNSEKTQMFVSMLRGILPILI